MRAAEFVSESLGEKLLPEPGTLPIKPGYVRLYHQTSLDNIESIKRNGLLMSKAKGVEGPKSIWAGETPFYGNANDICTVEFQIPKQNWDPPFVNQSQVTPDEFLAVHEPWHKHARYMLSHPSTLKQVLNREYDDLGGDYKMAIDFIKKLHREGKLND